MCSSDLASLELSSAPTSPSSDSAELESVWEAIGAAPSPVTTPANDDSTDVSFSVSDLMTLFDPAAPTCGACVEDDADAWAGDISADALWASTELDTDHFDAFEPIASPPQTTVLQPLEPNLRPSCPSDRNALERREWTPYEDERILSGVHEFGKQWRRIAARLPGRSDDAVRNRWSRLKSLADAPCDVPAMSTGMERSEEHTSELQSP